MKHLLLILIVFVLTEKGFAQNMTAREYSNLCSKLPSTEEAAPLTSFSLNLTKDANLAFKINPIPYESYDSNRTIKCYGTIDGELKSNNGYVPIFSGGKLDGDLKLGGTFSVVYANIDYTGVPLPTYSCLKNRCDNQYQELSYNQGYFIFWSNLSLGYQNSSFTLITPPSHYSTSLK